MDTQRNGIRYAARRAFTLIELLVVMTIIVILGGLTLAAVNVGIEGDRLAGGARQVQSMIEGARDRAIYAGQPRGVRLVLDPTNSQYATSLVFIGPPSPFGVGQQVTVTETSPGVWTLADSEFDRLSERGLIGDTVRIQLRKYPGDVNAPWYTAAYLGSGTNSLQLTKPPLSPFNVSGELHDYSLILRPAVLPNQEPRQLPRNVVIDLPSSQAFGKIPGDWATNPGEMDILFNSRGTVEGRLASQGVIHLVVADLADLANGFNVGIDALDGPGGSAVAATATGALLRESEETVVSVFTRTGTVSNAAVDLTDADSDGLREDPFKLAEGGR